VPQAGQPRTYDAFDLGLLALAYFMACVAHKLIVDS
jgi:hypothetical protein